MIDASHPPVSPFQGRVPWPADSRGRGAQAIVQGMVWPVDGLRQDQPHRSNCRGADGSSRQKECAWMPEKMAKSRAQTSFGNVETPEALRSPRILPGNSPGVHSQLV